MHYIVVHYGDMLHIHSSAIQGLYEHGWMDGWSNFEGIKIGVQALLEVLCQYVVQDY